MNPRRPTRVIFHTKKTERRNLTQNNRPRMHEPAEVYMNSSTTKNRKKRKETEKYENVKITRRGETEIEEQHEE